MIFASLGLDWANFRSGINGAMASTRQLNGAMGQSMAGGVMAGIMGAVGNLSLLNIAFKTVTFAAHGLRDAIQLGDDLVDLNAQTGVAVDKLMELQMAFDLNGMKAEQLQPVLAKMQRAIADAGSGSADAAAKFAIMGIQIADLQGMTADQQLMAIGEAITKIQNPAQQAAMAMEVFGKSGAKLLSVFKAGGMDEIRRMLGGQAQLLLDNAGVFGRASDILGLTGSKVRGFFVGIASEIVPQLMEVLDRSAELDFSKVGKDIGSAVPWWISYFENFGTQGDMIYNTLKLAFASAINFFAEEISVTVAQVGASMKNVFKGQKAQEAAIKEAEITARAKGPFLDMTEVEASLQEAQDKVNALSEKKAKAAREKYGTPGAGPTGLDFVQKPGQMAATSLITTSMAKVGALGSSVWSSDSGINVQRDQLATQKRIADSIDSFLKQAGTPTANPYLGTVTPQLGVI